LTAATQHYFTWLVDGGREGTLATCLVFSSLGWSTVWLVRWGGKSAGTGGLIDGSDTMLFLGMIDGGNMMLLHSAGQWWEGENTGHPLGVTDKILTHKNKTLFVRRNT
jgi:hypothetical protein